MPERNLIIIHRGPEYARDFQEIAEKICATEPGISVFCVDSRTSRVMPDEAWNRPSLTVALLSHFKAHIRRGPILANRQIDKPNQYRAFWEAGLPTPPTLRYTPGMKLDPIMFGEYVVIKPIDPNFGSYGRGIQLFRRRKLETMLLSDFPADHPIRRNRGGYIVQRFIDTGPLLPLYRVTTLFGAPLFCWLEKEKVPLPPLGQSDAEIEARRVVSNTGDFRHRYPYSEDHILDLSLRVGNAMADIPLLGMDIICEEKSGKPYVLECNPGGNTWHFSSKLTTGVRRHMGGVTKVGEKKAELLGRQMLIDQFGAWDRAADVLIKKTKELAA